MSVAPSRSFTRLALAIVIAAVVVSASILSYSSLEAKVTETATTTSTTTQTTTLTQLSTTTITTIAAGSNQSAFTLPASCVPYDFTISAVNPTASNHSTLTFYILRYCDQLGPVIITVDNAGVVNGGLSCVLGMGCTFIKLIPQSVTITAGNTYAVLVWIYPQAPGSSGNYNATVLRTVYNVTAG